MTAKHGTPYFSNYINSDMQPSDVRSMCCRLRLDLWSCAKRAAAFWFGRVHRQRGRGDHQPARIAYQAKDEADFTGGWII